LEKVSAQLEANQRLAKLFDATKRDENRLSTGNNDKMPPKQVLLEEATTIPAWTFPNAQSVNPPLERGAIPAVTRRMVKAPF
jgi:hypothetical protein